MDRREALACLADDPDDVYNRRMFGLVPTTIVLVLSIVTYGLRIYCRRKTGQGVKWDDILMGIGTVISFEPAICEYLLLANGLGHHICHVPADQSKRFAVISFALQRANQPALACIKLSILLFYLRIFSSERWLRWAAYANMAYTICWAISTWIVNLTVCTPIAFYYDHTIPGGKCKNQVISGTANGALSLLGDVCILVLPLPVIWKLKINTRRKIALCGVFLLGCL
ncbi:uncharacterized protein THITE_2114613 [Thermothielavioides terrestris NRRL 8126]|uniref:Rhodopsin domain-containing protein n=2 Tax=Thermothielavioides terrestris TaxID=2587410 RepID=G2R0L8_THETT|nr:uncharacterized protein THITE_2114613 [Thermothielavioides terrestris NRRL 8126]AEO66486.1 hypothetical protein THITE_2114613 [Thermothielavioides terrestris NRRL 8126]